MMRILYVEDNPANLFLVKRVAKVGGHEVINYIDGEQALSNIEQDKPDMILMDIQLAGAMSGLDVVQKLRSDGCHLPIIAVTAYAMLGDRDRFLAAGCDDYLAKPLPIPRLVEMLEHYDQQLDNKSKPKTSPLVPRPSLAEVLPPSEDLTKPSVGANGTRFESLLNGSQPNGASASPNGTSVPSANAGSTTGTADTTGSKPDEPGESTSSANSDDTV
jgi:CheY-like chemotaxis protein